MLAKTSTKAVLLEEVCPAGLFQPAGDMHKVGNKARDDTLKDDVVAPDDVLIGSFSDVVLRHN